MRNSNRDQLELSWISLIYKVRSHVESCTIIFLHKIVRELIFTYFLSNLQVIRRRNPDI